MDPYPFYYPPQVELPYPSDANDMQAATLPQNYQAGIEEGQASVATVKEDVVEANEPVREAEPEPPKREELLGGVFDPKNIHYKSYLTGITREKNYNYWYETATDEFARIQRKLIQREIDNDTPYDKIFDILFDMMSKPDLGNAEALEEKKKMVHVLLYHNYCLLTGGEDYTYILPDKRVRSEEEIAEMEQKGLEEPVMATAPPPMAPFVNENIPLETETREQDESAFIETPTAPSQSEIFAINQHNEDRDKLNKRAQEENQRFDEVLADSNDNLDADFEQQLAIAKEMSEQEQRERELLIPPEATAGFGSMPRLDTVVPPVATTSAFLPETQGEELEPELLARIQESEQKAIKDRERLLREQEDEDLVKALRISQQEGATAAVGFNEEEELRRVLRESQEDERIRRAKEKERYAMAGQLGKFYEKYPEERIDEEAAIETAATASPVIVREEELEEGDGVSMATRNPNKQGYYQFISGLDPIETKKSADFERIGVPKETVEQTRDVIAIEFNEIVARIKNRAQKAIQEKDYGAAYAEFYTFAKGELESGLEGFVGNTPIDYEKMAGMAAHTGCYGAYQILNEDRVKEKPKAGRGDRRAMLN